MWDMPLAGTSDKKHIPHWAGNIIWAFVGIVFKICFRYRIEHRQNLRAFKNKRGVVVIANHTSFLDVVFMYLAARPSQWIRFLGRDTLFGNAHGLAGQILSRVGAFPIKRNQADRKAIKRATTMLKDKELVGILPEGTRRNKGSLKPELHAGAAFIARMGNAPILPMCVRNAEKIKEKGKFLRFPKVSVEFGTPILLSDFDFLPKEDRLEACTWYAMRECFALYDRVSASEVDMRALFPDNRDFSDVFAEHEIPVHSSVELAGAGDEEALSQTAAAATSKKESTRS